MNEILLSFLAEGLFIAFLDSNPHEKNFERGYRLLEVGCETNDEDTIKRAADEFLQVDNDDLLYLQVAANYYLAICFAKLNKFAVSYKYIDMVQAVDYDFFTRKKDTIEIIRKSSYELRPLVQEAEKEYLAYLERLRREQARQHNGDDGNFWKIVTIVGICLFVVLIVLLIIFLLS